jgi:hypothetical protein
MQITSAEWNAHTVELARTSGITIIIHRTTVAMIMLVLL